MKGIFIGRLWFESFEYHFKERKRRNQLKYNTKEEYINIIKTLINEGSRIFYVNEKGRDGAYIDKIYFSDDKWLVTIKFDDFNNLNTITAFRLDGYDNLKDYFIQRNKYLDPTEVKDDHEYRRIVKIIRDRIKS